MINIIRIATDVHATMLWTAVAITFILLLIFFALNFRNILQVIKKVRKSYLFIILAIFLLGLILRVLALPQSPAFPGDDFNHFNVAESIVRFHKPVICLYDAGIECKNYYIWNHPPGQHFLISLLMLAFGSKLTVAFFFSAALASLSIILMFLTAYLLFKNENIAVIAALLLCINRIHLFNSTGSILEMAFLFFSLLTIFALLLFFEKKELKTFGLLVFSTAYLVQTKAEGVLFIPLMICFFMLLRHDKAAKKENKKDLNKKSVKPHFKKSFIAILIIATILILPCVLNISYLHGGGYSTENKDFKVENLNQKWQANLEITAASETALSANTGSGPSQVISRVVQKIMISLSIAFFCIGLLTMLFKDSKKALLLLAWGALFFVMYSAYMSYVTERFLLQIVPAFIIILSYGFEKTRIFWLKICKKSKILKKSSAVLLIVLLLVLLFVNLAGLMKLARADRAYNMKEYDFIMKQKSIINQSCLVISDNAQIMHPLLKVNSIMDGLFLGMNETEQASLINDSNGCVFFYREGASLSKNQISLDEKYRLELVDQVKDRFAFYNLTFKEK